VGLLFGAVSRYHSVGLFDSAACLNCLSVMVVGVRCEMNRMDGLFSVNSLFY